MKKEEKFTSNHFKWTLATFFTWTFDLYDLFTILLIAPYISSLFFPSSITFLSIAATYAGFATSLIMRPVGATVFGSRVSDKVGRKRAIFYGLIGLVITSTLQGALPTYQVVGIMAPVLLLAVRLIQGVFIGGITAGSHVIGPESVPERYRGIVGGLGFSAAGVAYLIAAGWFFLTTILYPGSSYLEWGWRVMFFGGLLSLAVLGFVNYLVPESEVWTKIKKRGSVVKSPLKEIFSKYKYQLGVALLLSIGWGASFYVTDGILPTFLSSVNKLAKTEIAIVMIIGSIGMSIGPLIGGEISQIIGRKITSLIGAIIILAIVGPLFLSLGSLKSSDLNQVILHSFAILFLVDIGGGMLMTYLNEIYPASVRGTGVGFTWNTGFAIGGTIPTIISLAVASAGLSAFPSIMFYTLIVISVIILVGTILTKETKGTISKEEYETQKESL
ncbi:MFS transporter [Sulfolobus acidocaldarius SUSAZ]|nr:MFS transporter [Sulfolobus acidocaldarius SUSAZ]